MPRRVARSRCANWPTYFFASPARHWAQPEADWSGSRPDWGRGRAVAPVANSPLFSMSCRAMLPIGCTASEVNEYECGVKMRTRMMLFAAGIVAFAVGLPAKSAEAQRLSSPYYHPSMPTYQDGRRRCPPDAYLAGGAYKKNALCRCVRGKTFVRLGNGNWECR